MVKDTKTTWKTADHTFTFQHPHYSKRRLAPANKEVRSIPRFQQ